MTMPLAGRLRPWVVYALDGGTTEGSDAAVVYRQAFVWAKGLGTEETELLRRAASIALDDRPVLDLIHQARPALKAIREAAAIDQCRWGSQIVEIDDLGKDYLDVSNINIIRVACLSARRLSRSGQSREALDNLFAGLTLAHRIGTGGILFSRILECGGEVPAFQTLGHLLPELGRLALDDLARRLEILPPPEPASAAIGPESRFILGSLCTKLMTIGATIGEADWAEVGFDPEQAAQLRQITGANREKLLAHIQSTGPAFLELARRLDLPRPECRTSLDQFAEAERSINPIVAGLVEYAWGVRHVVDRMRALRSMLHAGLVLVRDGEIAFHAESDPFRNGGFALERRGNGYLIRSALHDEGKPEVSLQIGDVKGD